MVRTLKEYFGNTPIEYFMEKNAIETLMEKIGIGDQKLTGIETTSRINDDRFYVIFNTIKDGHGNKGRHIIDVIFSEPTWRQMMDVTFGAGPDCDSRIVIYDNAAQSFDKVSNRETAVKFASINNECGVGTYIINASSTENCEKNNIELKYDIEVLPDRGFDNDYYKLPLQEEFEQAEFWLYFDETDDYTREMLYDPDWWMGGPMTYLIDGIIGLTPSWRNDGFYVQVTADNDNYPGHQMLVKLIDNKRHKIERHFEKYELKIIWEPNTPIEITVKFDERPFKDFIFMTIEEKCKYIEKYRNLKDELSCFLSEELFENINETENRVEVEATS
jgi:hypothetical protein